MKYKAINKFETSKTRELREVRESLDLAFGEYQMDYQLGEARTHRCQRSLFYHLGLQERQLSWQTHYADSVVVVAAAAELVAEEAMQMVTNPEDDHFCHQRNRCLSLLCSGSGPLAGSVSVGIFHSLWFVPPIPPRSPVA